MEFPKSILVFFWYTNKTMIRFHEFYKIKLLLLFINLNLHYLIILVLNMPNICLFYALVKVKGNNFQTQTQKIDFCAF